MAPPTRWASGDGQYHDPQTQQSQEQQRNDYWERPSPSSSAAVPPSKPAVAATGFGSFLKKAVKAAQTGLQHLEIALEKGMEKQRPLSGSGSEDSRQSRVMGTTAPPMVGRPSSGSAPQPLGSRRTAAGEEEDDGAAKALEVALRIMELPMEVRSDALAQLRPQLRGRVEEVLREQALLEGVGAEEAGQQGYEQVIHTHEFDPYANEPRRPAAAAPPAWVPPTAVSMQAAAAAPTASLVNIDDSDGFFSGGAGNSDAPVAKDRPRPPPPPRPSTPSADRFGDFPGSTVPSPAVPQPASTTMDLMGMGAFDGAVSAPPTSSDPQPSLSSHPAAPYATVSHHAVEDLGNDFFSGGSVPRPTATATPAPSSTAAAAAASLASSSLPARSRPAAARPAADLMGGLHDDVDVGNNQHLYQEEDAGEGRPGPGVTPFLSLYQLLGSNVWICFLCCSLCWSGGPHKKQNVFPLQARRASLSSAGSCGRRGSPRSTPR